MDNINIELLEKEDYHRGFLNLLGQLSIINPNKITFEDFCSYLEMIDSHIIVIRNKDKQVIATASILIEKKFIHNLSSVGHIEDVVVDKEYRGFKLGKLMIDYLVNYAKEKGCYKVILGCSKENLEFYKKCGFDDKNIEMCLYFSNL